MLDATADCRLIGRIALAALFRPFPPFPFGSGGRGFKRGKRHSFSFPPPFFFFTFPSLPGRHSGRDDQRGRPANADLFAPVPFLLFAFFVAGNKRSKETRIMGTPPTSSSLLLFHFSAAEEWRSSK